MSLPNPEGREWYQRFVHSATYRPDIDGLRAIAVMMVIGYHAFPSIFKGGFVGVDIFFVISGYLISTILLRSLSEQTYRLTRFYCNRIKRIFPALLAVLIFCLIAGWFLFTAAEFKQLGKHVAGGSVFLSNIIYMNERGYFDMDSETKSLLHLWSLAVEEQFYILLPPLLWFLYKIRAKAFEIIVVIAVCSFLIALFGTPDPTVKFYSLQTRVWELLLGTIIAWYEHTFASRRYVNSLSLRLIFEGVNKLPNFFSTLGVSLVIVSLILINRQQVTPGVWTLLPTIGASLLIIVGMRGWFNRTILSSRLFVAIGLISYPLYLWHWPLLVITTIAEGTRPSISHRLVAIAVTFVLSITTYFLIERPIRFGRNENLKTAILVALMICVGSFGYAVYRDGGYEQRTFAWQFKNVSEAIEDWEGDAGLMNVTYLGQPVLGNSMQPPEILFIGDSHVEQFLPRVVKLTQANQFPSSIFVLGAGCPPIENVFEESLARCQDTLKRIAVVTQEIGSVKKIVVGGCWNCYFIAETKSIDSTGKGFNYYYQSSGAVRQNFRGGQGAALALDQLERLLQKLSEKYQVYLLLDNPLAPEFAPKNLIGNRITANYTLQNLSETVRIDPAKIALNERLKDIAQRAGAQSIDQLGALCREDRCLRLTRDKKPIYKDEHHLRPFFVKDHADYFEKELLRQ
jgi:peptidoglycan/LPS O-acetylase OafA/YrhL